MKKIIALTILAGVLLLSLAQAQIPNGYYDPAKNLTGTPLRLALHGIIDNHTSITYNSIPTYFKTTDSKSNGKVWDIYSDVPNGTLPYEYSYTSADQCGNYSKEGDCFNREHSWPQSWFNSASPMVSDLFHIYPTDGYVNGKRANFPYGEVAAASYTSQNGGKLGPCSFTGYGGTVFEPIDEYKGDLARSYFYMCTRYYTEDASWIATPMTNKAELEPWAVNLLLKWHHQDTVSAKEIDRNNAIYLIQDNRNPYIDHPEYADSIWIATPSSVNELEKVNLEIALLPNPANNTVTLLLSNSTVKLTGLYLYDCVGRIVTLNVQAFNELNVQELPSGFYFLKAEFVEGEVMKKLVVEH